MTVIKPASILEVSVEFCSVKFYTLPELRCKHFPGCIFQDERTPDPRQERTPVEIFG